MSFEKEVNNFMRKLPENKDINNEEETKSKLIKPFLKLLGYNFSNSKVKEEYPVVIKASNKGITKYADIVILDKNNEPEIVIECKSLHNQLGEKYKEQLETYYKITGSRIGILTNGIIYKFFTSINKGMDKEPFLEIDLNNLTNEDIIDLKMFKKEEYDFKKILSIAKLIQYSIHFEKHLKKEINYPSDEFINLITEKFYKKDLSNEEINKFRKAIIKKFKNIELKEKPKPPLIDYNGLGKKEFNKFFKIYNNLPKKFKSEKPPVIAKRFKKYGKWEKMEKGVLYANENTNIIRELFTKYFRQFIPEYKDEISKTNLIKYNTNFELNSAKIFAKYVNGDKLNTEEKKLLNEIFS